MIIITIDEQTLDAIFRSSKEALFIDLLNSDSQFKDAKIVYAPCANAILEFDSAGAFMDAIIKPKCKIYEKLRV